MLFQSYVPNCMDVNPVIPKQEFKSWDHLLDHQWIKSFKNDKGPDFEYFWADNEGIWSKCVLMAQWKVKGNKTWWVIGFSDEIPLNLKKWNSE